MSQSASGEGTLPLRKNPIPRSWPPTCLCLIAYECHRVTLYDTPIVTVHTSHKSDAPKRCVVDQSSYLS